MGNRQQQRENNETSDKKNGCRLCLFHQGKSVQIQSGSRDFIALKSPPSSLLLSAFEICGSCQSFWNGLDKNMRKIFFL